MNSKDVKKLIKENKNKFYVYIMKRPDGRPFYIGKGGNNNEGRIFCHVMDVQKNISSTNKYKNNIIQKILNSGEEIDYEIALFTEDASLALDKEKELISFYGRKNNKIEMGILSNITPGGEIGGNGGANKGQVRTLFERQKMSISHRGQVPWIKDKHHSQDTIEKLIISHTGYVMPQEQINKISESNSLTKGTVEYRKMVSEQTSGDKNPFYNQKHTNSSLQKMSKFQLKLWEDPEYKKKQSESHKKPWSEAQREGYNRRKNKKQEEKGLWITKSI